MSAALRSGELAGAAGVNLQTLRYYERRGLLAEPVRSPGGHRLYPAEALTVLRVIKTAQRLGFTLDEIADLVDLGRHRHGRLPDHGLQSRATAKLAEIEAKIADLQVMAATLRTAIDAGCDDLTACAANSCCPLPFAGLDRVRRPVVHGRHERVAGVLLRMGVAGAGVERHDAPDHGSTDPYQGHEDTTEQRYAVDDGSPDARRIDRHVGTSPRSAC